MTLATLILGAAALNPGGIFAWLLVGLIAGFLASRVMRGGGYGLIGDIIVGLIGAFIGGWLAGFLGFGATYGLIGSIVIAFIGACILIAILHAVTGGASRSRRWGRR
ncbi:MAG: GlsB/YeaQ/YmgE family stress response membrane protein [Ktedonobacteraceae bacterium]